jgi:gliotoxin biosynthesis N-methyltransferase
MTFRVQDIREPWPHGMQGTFDLVHQRFVFAGVAGTPPDLVVKRLAGLLKPGGWLQMIEMDFQSDSTNLPELEEFFAILRHIFKGMGMGDGFGRELKDWMEDAGLQNVQEHLFLAPHGEVIGDKSLKQKSIESPCAAIPPLVAMLKSKSGGTQSSSLQLTVIAMPHPFEQQEIDTLEARLRRALNEKGGHSSILVVWGQKP